MGIQEIIAFRVDLRWIPDRVSPSAGFVRDDIFFKIIKMKIYIGTDHAGYELKEGLKIYLKDLGHDVEDKGAFEFDEQDDYPDFIFPVAKAVAGDVKSKGIILGGSGQGEAMAANRIKGIRAAIYYGGEEEIIKLSREHNNANILSLGARFLDLKEAKKAVKMWLETPFSDEERHTRRISKIDKI